MSRTNSWDFAAGEDIVPGRIAHKLLGGGSSYEAYLAFDEELYTAVVVKIVRPEQVESTSTLRGIRREAAMLDQLSHPVIVRGFDATLDGPRPHLVLEHLEGPRLSRLLRKHGPLPLEQLLPLALEVCSALHYMSRRNVVHLDVKPSNIIMGSPPRLIDLSIARDLEAAAGLRHVIGTDSYLAPEQADPVNEPPGSPADVFGLGATLYEASAGYTPWSSKDLLAEDGSRTYPQLTAPPRELPRSVPPVWAELLLACLARRPADRPSASEVAEAVEPLIARLPKPVLGGFRPQKRV